MGFRTLNLVLNLVLIMSDSLQPHGLYSMDLYSNGPLIPLHYATHIGFTIKVRDNLAELYEIVNV